MWKKKKRFATKEELKQLKKEEEEYCLKLMKTHRKAIGYELE